MQNNVEKSLILVHNMLTLYKHVINISIYNRKVNAYIILVCIITP